MNHGSFHAKAPTCADYMPLTINSVTSETLVKETFRPVCEGPAMQELQFNCLKCGQRIACDARGAGIEISCPTCQRSEEHTSELQSHHDLVCRLLLEKKKKNTKTPDLHQPRYQTAPDH